MSLSAKTSKPISSKIILFFLCLSILLGGSIYFVYFTKIKEVPTVPAEKTPLPELTQSRETESWQTYVNQKFHFSFKYPPLLELAPLAEGDNPLTEEAVETGDEGTFIVEKSKDPETMDRTMAVFGLNLNEKNKNLTLKDFGETQGSFIDPCQEDKAQRVQEITTKTGIKGIKAWYWVKKGCQGAPERILNSPYVFFDDRSRTSVIVEFYEGQMSDYFETIVSTFEFTKPLKYED